jgi:hypothetical protein
LNPSEIANRIKALNLSPFKSSKAFGIAFAAAILVIAIVVWGGFVETKGNHLAPAGKIGKVRSIQVDDNEAILVFDFNLKNDSDVLMTVHSIEGSLDASDGSTVEGSMVAAADLANVFRYYPGLGEQYNPPLKARDTLAGHADTDRMVALRFDVPAAVVDKRKGVTLRIEDITGPVAELKAK